MKNSILEPVIVLVAWTLVIFVWMMATRLPYLMKNNISAQELQNASDVAVKLPGKERRVSDNYNHLHEQFYAIFGHQFVMMNNTAEFGYTDL